MNGKIRRALRLLTKVGYTITGEPVDLGPVKIGKIVRKRIGKMLRKHDKVVITNSGKIISVFSYDGYMSRKEAARAGAKKRWANAAV